MAVRTNLVLNPSFEDGATAPTPPADWLVEANSSTGFFWEDNSSRHQTVANSSTRSLRLNNSSAAANALYTTLSLAAGTYTVSVWAQVLASTTNAALMVRTHSGGSASAGTLWGEQHWTSPNNVWTRKSITFTLTATTSIDVFLGLGIGTGGTSAGSVRFDEVLLEAGSTLNDYFDGGFTATSSVTYSWNGTANNSTSKADDGSVVTPPPVVNNGWALVESNSAATTFATNGALDSTKFYTKTGFNGTNGDGTYYADRTYVQGGQVIVMPDQDHIGGFDSRHRPLTYGKWDVYMKLTPVVGYKCVIFLWPDSEAWTDGEWDFVECTDSTGATFQIFFHLPGNPTNNSKQTRVTQNITGAFNKFTIEKLPTSVTVKVNDLQVYQVTDTAWVGTTPCHLVVQTDVGMPDGANGVSVRAGYPANTNPRFQVAISQIDIWVPATVSANAPLSASDQGSSSDSGVLGTTRATLFSSDDDGASTDHAQLLVPRSLLAATERGQAIDVASLSVNGSTPSTMLIGYDEGTSLDFGRLAGSSQYLNANDRGRSLDTATLQTAVDLSVRPVVGSVAEEIYESLSPISTDDPNNGWALLRLISAIADPTMQWTNDLVRDTDAGTGWSTIMDLDQAPADVLPWLAQFVGVDTSDDLDVESQRLRIRETAGFQRGTRSSVEGAARQYLSGSRTVLVSERDTSPYHLTVTTFAAETPEPSKVGAALEAAKPAGLVLEFVVSSGASYGALKATGLTYRQLQALYSTPKVMKLAVLV